MDGDAQRFVLCVNKTKKKGCARLSAAKPASDLHKFLSLYRIFSHQTVRFRLPQSEVLYEKISDKTLLYVKGAVQ